MNIRNSLLTGLAAASVALAGCASSPGYSGYSSPGYGSTTASCYDCGTHAFELRFEETSELTGAVAVEMDPREGVVENVEARPPEGVPRKLGDLEVQAG